MERPGLKARALIALAFLWAAPLAGAAHSAVHMFAERGSFSQRAVRKATPAPVRLREGRGRGLLVDAWIDGSGPFVFAVDTGAGRTLIRPGVAASGESSVRGPQISGISSNRAISTEEVIINNLAVGDRHNMLASRIRALIVSNLPPGIDGILDPTEAYAPFGYVIDMPKRQLLAFDTSTNRLNLGSEPAGGAVVRWLREPGGTRPFVRLGDNRLALIDTGSGFGLAVSQGSGASAGNRGKGKAVRDLGGGTVESKRVEPTTVTIGSLVLRRVPTDIVIGAHEGVPVLLGRDALYPFRITFDPASRLIELVPSADNN